MQKVLKGDNSVVITTEQKIDIPDEYEYYAYRIPEFGEDYVEQDTNYAIKCVYKVTEPKVIIIKKRVYLDSLSPGDKFIFCNREYTLLNSIDLTNRFTEIAKSNEMHAFDSCYTINRFYAKALVTKL